MANIVDDADFTIHNRKAIVFALEDLVKHRTMINLHTPGGVNLLTSILEVSSEENYIYIDISQDPAINTQIANSKNMTFSTQTGVRVRWRSEEIGFVELPDGDAFAIEIPEVIERIQRREYFRLNVPQGSKALTCKIPDEAAVLEVSVVDMSVGGIGISVKGDPPAILSHGEILKGCSVEFPAVGVVPLNLKVCGMRVSAISSSGEKIYHIGMEFVDLSRGASNVVQRHMIQLESERISLS